MYECSTCGKRFKEKDALEQHRKDKHVGSSREDSLNKFIKTKKLKSYLKYASTLLILALIIFGIYYLASNSKTYPPTDLQGHVESYPESRISSEPIPIPLQKHVLEHVPTTYGQKPGAVVQYNCEKYECEPDLVDNLEALVLKYEHVYLAPYPKMDTKIALTKPGKLEVLDEFDEDRITRFIE